MSLVVPPIMRRFFIIIQVVCVVLKVSIEESVALAWRNVLRDWRGDEVPALIVVDRSNALFHRGFHARVAADELGTVFKDEV